MNFVSRTNIFNFFGTLAGKLKHNDFEKEIGLSWWRQVAGVYPVGWKPALY
jgi:hypothetical protein